MIISLHTANNRRNMILGNIKKFITTIIPSKIKKMYDLFSVF